MDGPRRSHYLNLLGIDTYRRRAAGDAAAHAPQAVAATGVPRAAAARQGEPAPASAAAGAPVVAAVAAAPGAARVQAPADWSGLRAAVQDCRACKLCATRTQTVFGVGLQSAPLMVIGEGPGADEDAQGEPFVGRAGKLLDEMLASIGRARTETRPEHAVFIANVVKCRPPGNRDPESDEVEACRPYLDRQIELVEPRLIVALGRIAAQRLLSTDTPLSKLRGPLYHYGAAQTPVLVTYHPAYLLRSPREKAKSWEDLKRVHRLLRASA
ncbi:uracil-DNA glycosylase [Fontimonas sp. SYSU GA230001]|uniref:uracil-DNA glycosylase n=1 Tax=Fontimonas sp. SYSU GA230001 TaxID=3142450 RepID=UPI0032B3CB97